jgi:vacuolar-type H+-ATPase subunit H
MGKTEILHQIKVAEEQVRAMAGEAEEKRKQLQADGKKRALEKIEAADASLRKQIDAATATSQARVDGRKKALLEEGRRKADALAAGAKARSGKVKEFVLTEFESAIDA